MNIIDKLTSRIYRPYPYTIEQKEGVICLTILPRKGIHLGWLANAILWSAILISNATFSTIFIVSLPFHLTLVMLQATVLLLKLFILAWSISNYWWRRHGQEVFTLQNNKLEYTQRWKMLKPTSAIFSFDKIEINSQILNLTYFEEDEDEDEVLETELNEDEIIGYHYIQFYIDDGQHVITSERRIPSNAINIIKNEFIKLRTND